MLKQLTEVEEQLLYRLEEHFGYMSSEEALEAAIEVEAVKRETPSFYAQFALKQVALERYAELREKEEALCRLLVMEPGEVPHFTQPERADHA